jgi:hypothetical protein
VFLYDPDRIKIEILTRPRLRTALWALRPSTTPSDPRTAADRGDKRRSI